MPTQPSIRLQRHLVHDRLMIPRRIREHLLKLLFVRIRNPFLHAFHILLVRIGLHQTPQRVPNRLEHTAGRVLKMPFEAQTETGKALGNVIERVGGGISKKKFDYS
jgi:hypothetical protein